MVLTGLIWCGQADSHATPPPRSQADRGGSRSWDRPPTRCRTGANGLTTPSLQPRRSPWLQPTGRTLVSEANPGSSCRDNDVRGWVACAQAWSGRRWLHKPVSQGSRPAARWRATHGKYHRGRELQIELPCARRVQRRNRRRWPRERSLVDQFQQPDAPGIGVAMLFRTQQEAEGGLGIDPHEDRIVSLEDLIEKTDVNAGEVVLLVDCLGRITALCTMLCTVPTESR